MAQKGEKEGSTVKLLGGSGGRKQSKWDAWPVLGSNRLLNHLKLCNFNENLQVE